MVGRATSSPSRETARSVMAPMARIAACGGLMTAVKPLMPNMPRLETVKVPPESSGGVIWPARTRSVRALVSRAISPSGATTVRCEGSVPSETIALGRVAVDPQIVEVKGPRTTIEGRTTVDTVPVDVTGIRQSITQRVGLLLEDIAVDGCITKAPCGGEVAGTSPVDRAKQGTKRSIAVDGAGIPLGVLAAPANCHDSRLLAPTLDLLSAFALPAGETTVHLDRGYDTGVTRTELARRGLLDCISKRGAPAPIQATTRWVVERTNAWHNTFKKLSWCTERRGAVLRFYFALVNTIIIVRRLLREAWKRYRWDARPRRRP